MWIHVASIFTLHVTTVILLLIATIKNAWWYTDTMATDVWGRWRMVGRGWTYSELPGSYPDEPLQVVQATTVLACLFSILGLFVYVAQLFLLRKGQKFILSCVFQLVSCLCIMIAASVYTATFHKDEDGWYGPSYVLAWISFVLTFISSICYFFLLKTTTES
ncbi:epithelial membrane protein 1 [Paramormyrops kingsleyae]|uniref:Epithelial membrane protein 1 n=1 Tax=Paramormyrops kingsleyae TaxID=1676925 RepID=A0A3B3QI82_9TELE|nr:epithelial membrane protein 2-like [Paramormyrops kingsleyae]